MTLTMPTPLGALEPATPVLAEPVTPISTGVPIKNNTKKNKKPVPPLPASVSRVQKEETKWYARPVSPLTIHSKERENESASGSETATKTKTKMKRENSLSRLGRRLTRRPSFNLRNSSRKSIVVDGGVSKSPRPEIPKRQSIAQLARRESAKLKSILKNPLTSPGGNAKQQQQQQKLTVQPKKFKGTTWAPPRDSLEKRQSASKFQGILKPDARCPAGRKQDLAWEQPNGNGNLERRPSVSSILKPTPDLVVPVPTRPSIQNINDNALQLQPNLAKPEVKEQIPIMVSSNRITEESRRASVQRVKPPVPPESTKPAFVQASGRGRDGKDIISEIDLKHLSAAEARRLIRQRNRDFFHSRIWDPAIQKDFAGAYLLANERDEVSEDPQPQKSLPQPQPQAGAQPQPQSQPVKRGSRSSWQRLFGPPPPPKDSENIWQKEVAKDIDDWSRSVRMAMAKVENRITTEASADPARFMKARRESAQYRAWVAAQRRASEARLSALASGRLRPESESEEAFVSELLRENAGRRSSRYSSNPFAEVGRAFRDSSRNSALLPHYTPISQYPLLTPLEDIEAEAEEDETSSSSLSDERPRRRVSVFDEKKAARRAGRRYKSFSMSMSLDQLDAGRSRCCGLWKPRAAFVDKIPA